MTYALSRGAVSLDLSNVMSERVSETSQLMEFSMPLSGSASTNIFDYMGVTRVFQLKVRFYGANGVSDIATEAAKIHGLQSGNQNTFGDGRCTLVSDVWGTVYVKVSDLEFEFKTSNPNDVEYTLTLKESANI